MMWFKGLSLTFRLILAGLALVALIWAGVFFYNLLTAGDRTRADLGENQTDAAVESGSDAVETVGGQGASEDDTDTAVQETGDAIDRAKDGAAVDAAGRDGLCRVAGLCAGKQSSPP